MNAEDNGGLLGRENFVFMPRRQSFDCVQALYYETVLNDPATLEVFSYTDRLSYRAGDEVLFHSSTTAAHFDIDIVLDGLRPQPIASLSGIRGTSVGITPDFFAEGCDWPVCARWRIPADAPPGFYIATSRARRGDDQQIEQDHGFFVLPPPASPRKILLIAATCTWTSTARASMPSNATVDTR